MRPAAKLLVPLSVLLAAQAWASGPMGHFIKSSHLVRQIGDGSLDVPVELKQALQNPEGQRAFNGGAIGPDLVEQESHYGNTADLAQKLLATARADMKKAAAEKNQTGFDAGQRELAFAYGWLTHCAADLNTHPKVNERVGDTFRFLDQGGKLAHGAMEGQETTYLKQTLWNPADKYDPSVPAEFLSRVTGVSVEKIRQMDMVLRGKAMGELTETGKVTLSHEELKRLWETTVRGGQHDAADFLRDPSKLRNWDLDCGRITTSDFDKLRQQVMGLNGGKLPPNWGRDYLAWHAAVQDLPRDKAADRLRQLMGLPATAPTGTGVEDAKSLEAKMNALRERHRELKRMLDASGGQDASTSKEMTEVYQEYLAVKKRHDALKK